MEQDGRAVMGNMSTDSVVAYRKVAGFGLEASFQILKNGNYPFL